MAIMLGMSVLGRPHAARVLREQLVEIFEPLQLWHLTATRGMRPRRHFTDAIEHALDGDAQCPNGDLLATHDALRRARSRELGERILAALWQHGAGERALLRAAF